MTLLVITLVSATAVGLVYQVTKLPIDQAKGAKTINALKKVLPVFDNDPSKETEVKTIDGLDVRVYTAKQGDEISGYAVESQTNKGFSGTISIMVGFRPNGEIVKIAVLSHAETPGLGAKIDQDVYPQFEAQYEGKNPAKDNLKVKQDGGQIDAITASTISSRAYSDAVDRAYKAVTFKAENNE